jgi:glycerol uptake facilitator protein
VLGAFVAAAALFVMFNGLLKEKEDVKGVVRGEPGSEITAMCYGEYFPNPGGLADGTEPHSAAAHVALNELVSEPVACFAEILGTAVLALVVAAVADLRNPMIPPRLASVFIGLTVAALICVIAPLTQACFNPARDFGPRLFAFLAGWGEIALPGPRPTGFLTVYIISPIVGAVIGVGVYWKLVAPVFAADPQHKSPSS